MKKLLLAALSVFACAAQAEERFYAGGNVAFWNYSQNDSDAKFNVSSLEGIAGYNVWKMINIEGRVGLGLESTTETASFGNVAEEIPTKFSINNYASLYVKPELENDIAKFYGLLGVTRVDAESENRTTALDLSVTGLSYGVGMGFFIADSAVVNIEYRSLVQEDDYKFTGFSLGFDISF
jgi:opacity protein-like surface antigen